MVYPPSPTCDIHILGRESAKSRRLRGEGGWWWWLEDEENGGGNGGRDGQKRLAVVGRASKPVVQTSGPMEATLVF